METIDRSPIPGLKELGIGVPGCGKTAAIATWLEAGITPFCIFTEPSFEVLGDARHGNILSKIHFNYCPAGTPSWETIISNARLIGKLTYEGLARLTDINKAAYHQFVDFAVLNNDFKCQRTGKSFGDVDRWGTDRVLVWDSLTGLSYMSITLMVGANPCRAQGEYGVAMDNIEAIIRKVCYSSHCHFYLTAHAENEPNALTGAVEMMAGTLGKKLAPKLPIHFSDVIIFRRTVDKFHWSVVDIGTQAKTRNLPFRADLPPSFVPVVEMWKSRGGIIEKTE